MALGDGIRRNAATVPSSERALLRNAIIELQRRRYPGQCNDAEGPGGVSYWFKQDQIHQATHVHHGPAFLPWHRELTNRFEDLLREVDPRLSLHYWDWTTDPGAWFDPNALLTSEFMGAATGEAGEPLRSAGFYNPTAAPDRSVSPCYPPRDLRRSKGDGRPGSGTGEWPSDESIVEQSDYPRMRLQLEKAHDFAHGYIGGTIQDPHMAFRDPFVYLLHSNVDRLFALWQKAPGKNWRLDPDRVYGTEGGNPAIVADMQPWAGGSRMRPWAPPDNQQLVKTCKDLSVVIPRTYDTDPPVPTTRIGAIDTTNRLDAQHGDLTARWARELDGVQSFALDGNRIGALGLDQRLYVKEGSLDATWVTQNPSAKNFALAGRRIGILDTTNTLRVKEGALNAPWVLQYPAAKGLGLAGRRVAVLDTANTLRVKEGALNAEWVLELAGVRSFALAGTRILALGLDQNLYAAADSLDTASWVLELDGVKSFALAGNRIGALGLDGRLFVKEGDLHATWVLEYGPVKSFALAGNRIGILDAGDNLRVKEGGLDANWEPGRPTVKSFALWPSG